MNTTPHDPSQNPYNAPHNAPQHYPVAAPYANPAASYPPATPHTAPVTTPDTRARNAGYALLGTSLVTFIAMITKSWFTASKGVSVGVLGMERCRGLLCESKSWFDVPGKVPTQIPIFASIALIAGLVAVAFIIHSAVMLLKNRPADVKLTWLSQLLGLATMGATAFIFSLSIGDWSKGLSIGYSSFLALAGLIGTGVVVATMVRPLRQQP